MQRFLTKTVEAGSIRPWQPSVANSGEEERFSINVLGTVYKCSTFALRDGYCYYCHTDSCKFPKTGCCHFAFFEDSQGTHWASQIIKCFICEDFHFSRVAVRQHRSRQSFWSAATSTFRDPLKKDSWRKIRT